MLHAIAKLQFAKLKFSTMIVCAAEQAGLSLKYNVAGGKFQRQAFS